MFERRETLAAVVKNIQHPLQRKLAADNRTRARRGLEPWPRAFSLEISMAPSSIWRDQDLTTSRVVHSHTYDDGITMPNSSPNRFRPRLPSHFQVAVHRLAIQQGRADEDVLRDAIGIGLRAISAKAAHDPACHARDRD